MEKGKPNIHLANKVHFFFSFFFSFSFFFFFFHFSHFSIFFLILKEGVTPLYTAAQKGHQQIVQLLLEKGRAINVDLATEVLFIFIFDFLFDWLIQFNFFHFHFFIFSFFSMFFCVNRMEELPFMLLLFKDMNKLFSFYWKKENQMLIFQKRFFSFFFFFVGF